MLLTRERPAVDACERLTTLVKGTVRFDVPMSRHTTLGIGGPADVWVEPADANDLSAVLAFCREHHWPWFVLGNGSNLLVQDGGVRGVVLSLCSGAFREIHVVQTRVRAGAGVANARLLERLTQEELGGMEYLCGIPGTVGGGVAMNAGAHGNCFADCIEAVTVMDTLGFVRELGRRDMCFEHRRWSNRNEAIVLEAVFNCSRIPLEQIRSRVQELWTLRRNSQPSGRSAGCVFKNSQGVSAGKIIDSLGLKGLRMGDARVSDRHANFIVNDGSARGADVLALIHKVRGEVFRQTGVRLDNEVIVMGEEST